MFPPTVVLQSGPTSEYAPQPWQQGLSIAPVINPGNSRAGNKVKVNEPATKNLHSQGIAPLDKIVSEGRVELPT